ncbi:MAG TPA: 2-oxo acid dehydrogenase subunit E2 [Candidatus Limnocylindria bacterium]|nr:2-oxo acid dehydrogenase subunit E2 [Candidatus Limnocylindria bacterium]
MATRTSDPGRIDIIVPQIGEVVSELRIVRWLKRPGDRVARGEILFEIDTEKTVLEVEAYEDGVLEEISADDGEIVAPLQRVGAMTPLEAATPRTPVATVGGPLSRARAAVAERTQHSKQQVPHFYLFADVEMTAALRLRASTRDALGRPPTITALVVRAVALTLAAHPEINASFVDGSLVARSAVSVGVAVGGDDALVVAVVSDAASLDLAATADAVRDATRRAREGRLREGDLGPRSTVVSNLGMHGVQAFAAIIDEPDPFIVAVGAVRDAVVAIDGAPAVRPVSTIALSVDHRALDGIQAARLLGELRGRLESADQLLP